jgi:SPP1 family predicted phage head-tail adaptor
MSIRSNVDGRRLDQRVTFQAKVEVQDDEGGLVDSWVDVVTNCPAAVDATPLAIARAEPNLVNGIRSLSEYTIWIRADVKERFGITVVHRAIWRGQPYNIADIPDQQLRGRLVALIVSTGRNAG